MPQGTSFHANNIFVSLWLLDAQVDKQMSPKKKHDLDILGSLDMRIKLDEMKESYKLTLAEHFLFLVWTTTKINGLLHTFEEKQNLLS